MCVRSYGGDGDIIGGVRNLKWMKDTFFSKYLSNYWKGFRSILDVGSGNGRLNKFLDKYFDEIFNIDPNVELDKRFSYGKTTYINGKFLQHTFGRKFDVISFNQSFRLFEKQQDLVLIKSLNLLNREGMIFIQSSSQFEETNIYEDQYFELDKLLPPLGLYRDLFVDTRIETRFSFIRRISERKDIELVGESVRIVKVDDPSDPLSIPYQDGEYVNRLSKDYEEHKTEHRII
uniref:Putative methyltransferase n=1 Tax=viral metagenome TaxID=1070528 RepID=A0A6M3IZN9_9ZZZZ